MKDCDECEGTGWTELGWEEFKKANDPATAGRKAFEGDCAKCNGTGAL